MNARSQAQSFFTAKELADRWRCSRSSVARIAQRFGLTRIYLGSGRHGMVRYPREEVEALEQRQRV